MLKLYRTIKPEDMQEIYLHRFTRRVPVNISYLVDNLWEWLRPDGFPSRRYCTFASSSPELAHAGASVASKHSNELIITEVEIIGSALISQIPEIDAKEHPDVKMLPKEIYKFLDLGWTEKPISNRIDFAPLFLPVISKDEVNEIMHGIDHGKELCELLIKASTFWQDAKILKVTDERLVYSEGEIFFEAYDGYRLQQVSSKNSL